MQCKVIPFNVMYVLSCFAMHWYVTLCKIGLCMYACCVMLCHGILFFVMLCYFAFSYRMLCCVSYLMYVGMYVCMYGWMDGWMDEWMYVVHPHPAIHQMSLFYTTYSAVYIHV